MSSKIIYLYVKQHSITGLKYFGKHVGNNPFKYKGSGLYWKRHIKKHGHNHIITTHVWGFDDIDCCKNFAIKFSIENNIVESSEWANMRIEDGISGGGNNKGELNSFYGKSHTEDFKLSQSYRMKGKEPWNKGKEMPSGFGDKVSARMKGRIDSPESKQKRVKSRQKYFQQNPDKLDSMIEKSKSNISINGKNIMSMVCVCPICGHKGKMNFFSKHATKCFNDVGLIYQKPKGIDEWELYFE